MLRSLGVLIAGLRTATATTGQSIAEMLVLGLLVPQLVVQTAMSFVSYIHRAHMRTLWYGSAEDYFFFNSRVDSTVHSEFPVPIGFVVHRIPDHIAHHSDPRVPLYNRHLTQAPNHGAAKTKFLPSQFPRPPRRSQVPGSLGPTSPVAIGGHGSPPSSTRSHPGLRSGPSSGTSSAPQRPSVPSFEGGGFGLAFGDGGV